MIVTVAVALPPGYWSVEEETSAEQAGFWFAELDGLPYE